MALFGPIEAACVHRMRLLLGCVTMLVYCTTADGLVGILPNSILAVAYTAGWTALGLYDIAFFGTVQLSRTIRVRC